MTLKLDLTVTEPRLLYQQDTHCVARLGNAGVVPVEVGIPPLDRTLPIVHVFNVQTGAEDEYRRKGRSRTMPLGPGAMAPGASLDSEFRLLAIVPQLPPGYYDIRVIWEYNGGGRRAESQFVRVQVLGTTPKSLKLVEAVGGRGGYKFGVSVNLSGDPDEPPRILRSSFALMTNGGVEDVLPVSECSLSCRPVMSAPAVGEPLRSHWIAWVDGQTVHYVHVDDNLGVGDQQSFPLPSSAMEIVPPLYGAPVESPSVSAPGGILLYQGAVGGPEFSLHSVWLTHEQAKGLGAVNLPGPKPLWIMSHVRSSNQWLVTYLQTDGAQLSLCLASWPGIQSSLPGPIPLADWPGELICAGATMGKDDLIMGGLLMWKMREDGLRRLVLMSWKVSPDNACDSQEQVIDWRPDAPVREARIGIRDDGQAAALIMNEDGTWQAFDGEGVQPVPGDLRKSKQPLELGFMNGIGKPVLIAGTVGLGFKVVGLDGSPLPTRLFP
jgi:hypothetical protein